MFREIRDFRRIYSVRSVLGYSGRKNWMVCPLPQHVHSDNPTPSFSIYYDRNGVERFKCHGNCQLKGDVIDLAGYLHVPGYNPDDINFVLRAVSVLGNKFDIDVPEKPKKSSLYLYEWKRFVPFGSRVLDYGKKRGLTKDTLNKFRIGQNGVWMTIPTFEENNLVGIKMRCTTPGGQRFTNLKGSRSGLFNHDRVVWTGDPVLIVKGEIPVMLLDQYDILACAPTGGEMADVSDYKKILAFSKKRVVVGDNDRNEEIRRRVRKYTEVRANALDAELVYPPEKYKDIDEWILDDKNSIDKIRRWIE